MWILLQVLPTRQQDRQEGTGHQIDICMGEEADRGKLWQSFY